MTSTKRASDYGGLRREPQMCEIVHYLKTTKKSQASQTDKQSLLETTLS